MIEKSCAEDYRFNFNGKETDKEWGGSGIQDYGFRLYNPAIAKFLSVDPLAPSYPWYTPYQFAGNMPIWAIDLDGLEEWKTNEGPIHGPYKNQDAAQEAFDNKPTGEYYREEYGLNGHGRFDNYITPLGLGESTGEQIGNVSTDKNEEIRSDAYSMYYSVDIASGAAANVLGRATVSTIRAGKNIFKNTTKEVVQGVVGSSVKQTSTLLNPTGNGRNCVYVCVAFATKTVKGIFGAAAPRLEGMTTYKDVIKHAFSKTKLTISYGGVPNFTKVADNESTLIVVGNYRNQYRRANKILDTSHAFNATKNKHGVWNFVDLQNGTTLSRSDLKERFGQLEIFSNLGGK